MKREAPQRGIVESRLCAQPVEVGNVLRQSGSKQGGLATAWSALTSSSQVFVWGLFRTRGPPSENLARCSLLQVCKSVQLVPRDPVAP